MMKRLSTFRAVLFMRDLALVFVLLNLQLAVGRVPMRYVFACTITSMVAGYLFNKFTMTKPFSATWVALFLFASIGAQSLVVGTQPSVTPDPVITGISGWRPVVMMIMTISLSFIAGALIDSSPSTSSGRGDSIGDSQRPS